MQGRDLLKLVRYSDPRNAAKPYEMGKKRSCRAICWCVALPDCSTHVPTSAPKLTLIGQTEPVKLAVSSPFVKRISPVCFAAMLATGRGAPPRRKWAPGQL